MNIFSGKRESIGAQTPNFQEGVIDEILIPGRECRVRAAGIYWHARISPGVTNLSPGASIHLSKQPVGNKLMILSE